MKTYMSDIVRQKFFDFFVARQHERVPSSSLIPAQDPTLLFANAGMNQFKDLFLGREKRSYTRAVSIQKCMRAGGKHNDLDNVGFTARHLTFFEMMGNFSFGDYFKKDAIVFAWDFLTEILGLDKNILYVSVYEKDEESYILWRDTVQVPAPRIVRLGERDNFWQMGDTGPCGPCTEIYVDRGVVLGCGNPSCAPGCSCDRFLEIWNLVFMQYDRQQDGTDIPLKRPGVDTGMGLERLCAVLQNKNTVYETDIFAPLIAHIEAQTDINYSTADYKIKSAINVLCDHIRSVCCAVADGVIPSNEGRGYVIRKIIRRAALFDSKLSSKSLFPGLAPVFIAHMGRWYPDLVAHEKHIITIITAEVEKFALNLARGTQLLKDYYVAHAAQKVINGEYAFTLYDTYGFPLEVLILVAREHSFTVDIDGFERAMLKQKSRSAENKKNSSGTVTIPDTVFTEFTGYQELETVGTVVYLVVDGVPVETVPAHTQVTIFFDKSPFYFECGGQVSDQGFVIIGGEKVLVQKIVKVAHGLGCEVVTPATLSVGDQVSQIVDRDLRNATMKNHTATHLLQAALIEILGTGVRQAGSVVNPDYLRFDFTCHDTVTSEQIDALELLVNTKIWENIPVAVHNSTYKQAIDRGVIAFFGDKYNPESVRTIEVPGFSAELCGGTHVQRTGDIGCFKIIELTTLAAGVKRLVAVTGPGALREYQARFSDVKKIAQDFKVKAHEIIPAIEKLRESYKLLSAQHKIAMREILALKIPEIISQGELVRDILVAIAHMGDTFVQDDLKELARLLQEKKPGLYILTAGKNIYLSVHELYKTVIDLKKIAHYLTQKYTFKGGGSGLFMQGSCAEKCSISIEEVQTIL